MAVYLSPVGGVAAQFFTNTGAVLTGGKLYTYVAGTTTPAATYTSAAGTTFNPNPIVLDAAGRVPSSGEIWLGSGVQYKFVLKDSTDVLIGTYDNVTGINSNFINYNALEEIQTATAGQTVFNLTNSYQPGTNTLSVFVDGINQYDGSSYSYTETNSTTVTFTQGLHVGALVKFTTAVTLSAGVTSSNLVTYQPAGTGAVATTVQAKLRQTVSVIDYGADPTGVADSTTAFNNAITAAGAYGNNGVILIPLGTFKLSSLSLSGDINITFLGSGGGSVGAISGSVLNFINTTGDGFSFNSASSYAANKIILQDIIIKANTTEYALAFNGTASPQYPVSEIYLNRVNVVNNGGTTYNTGNGIRFSECFYVYATGLNVEKTGSYIYSSGTGISIDKGSATSFVGGEFNFINCNFVNWYTGFQAGNQSSTPTTNELYPNINIIGCNAEACGTGISFYYGVVAALVQGCYVEGCLNYGIYTTNQAKNITIQSCFFNNNTATVADVAFGINGVSTSYTQFYNCAVKDCIFINVKNYGIFTYGTGTYNGIQNTLSIDNCNFTLNTAGAKGIASSSLPSSVSSGNQWFISVRNSNTYGFASGNGFYGYYTVLENCNEATSAGVPIIGYSHSGLVYGSYPTDYQILATDSETLSITNTRAGAKIYNAVPNTSKNRKQFIVNTSASTQSILVYYSNGVASGISLAPGNKILMWNDGQYEYISTL